MSSGSGGGSALDVARAAADLVTSMGRLLLDLGLFAARQAARVVSEAGAGSSLDRASKGNDGEPRAPPFSRRRR